MSDSDSQAIPFRSASASASPSSEPAPTDSAKRSPAPSSTYRAGSKGDDITPYVHQELTKKPYAVKFLDLGLYYDDADFEDVRKEAQALDAYVIKQAKARGLTDSKDSYKEVVDAIYKQIGRSANEDPVKSLKRLATAASAISRLESAKLQPVLSAKNLTPKEFEEVQP